MTKKTSMFSAEAISRQKEQEAIKEQLGLSSGAPAATDKKVRMNITLSNEHKDRLNTAAKQKHVSASVLIQQWIDENC